MKNIVYIFVGCILFSCKPQVDQINKKLEIELHNLKITPHQAMIKGIQLYKMKKNEKAIVYLAYATKGKSGKAYYYYGNVLMNLKRYKEALKAYKESYFSKYRIHNSLFNIACVYSLLKDYKNAMVALIENYVTGDRMMSRVKSDIDLQGFRKSMHYNKYRKILKSRENGFIPKDKKQILQYLLKKDWWAIKPGEVISTGIFFKKDGTFEWRFPGGNGGITPVGSWHIDNNRKFIVFKELGVVMETEDRDPKTLKKYLKNGFYLNNKKRVWKTIHRNPRTTIIRFKDIRLNVLYFSASIILKSYKFFRLNIYGYDKKNQYIHGRYIKFQL